MLNRHDCCQTSFHPVHLYTNKMLPPVAPLIVLLVMLSLLVLLPVTLLLSPVLLWLGTRVVPRRLPTPALPSVCRRLVLRVGTLRRPSAAVWSSESGLSAVRLPPSGPQSRDSLPSVWSSESGLSAAVWSSESGLSAVRLVLRVGTLCRPSGPQSRDSLPPSGPQSRDSLPPSGPQSRDSLPSVWFSESGLSAVRLVLRVGLSAAVWSSESGLSAVHLVLRVGTLCRPSGAQSRDARRPADPLTF